MRVHLIDGTYELFRAFFGAPPATVNGREVGASRGLVRSFAALLRSGAVTHGGVAFDHVIESFRNDLWAGYKTGDGLDPALSGQFELAERVSAALGLAVWPMIEHEADDALATAAARLAADARVEQVIVATPDKDLCQVVVGTRVVTWDRLRDRIFDEDGVRARLGVDPASVPDYLALVGDDADGIPGLPRWGARSAAAVLARYRRLEDIPRDGKWDVPVRGAAALAASLDAGWDEALIFRTLATLRTDSPIDASLEALTWRGPDRAALAALCDELEIDVPAL
ncbi:MAG TPA: 5'-3' exonuclease H3TH domain-containing protein [Kofleriaceae bacterium]|nr:5'-3' exonuclease H3TH domain-containing protein [Kofleriaceae bacterium]